MTRRRLILVVCSTALLVWSGLLSSLIPFLWPDDDSPERADAVILLSGDHGERLPLAMALIEREAAPTLVFDGTPDRALEEQLCAGEQVFEAVCLRPHPDSTRGEARAASALAHSRGWRTLIVVTSDFHVTRSRLLFERCFDGVVDVVGGRPAYGMVVKARQVAHEWLATLHALTVDRGC